MSNARPYARSGSWRGKRPPREDLPQEDSSRSSGYDHNAPKPTVGGCRPHEITTLLIDCSNYAAYCYHRGELPIADLPDDLLFEDLGRRCRCTKCGKKGAVILPDWSTSLYFRKRK